MLRTVFVVSAAARPAKTAIGAIALALLAAMVALGGGARAASAGSAAIAQSAQRSCLATPSDTITLTAPVAAGDALVLLVSGQGYGRAAPAVTGVSDPVNGQWSALVNHQSMTTDNLRYLSYAVYQVANAKAASSGLNVTVNETSGGTAASAVLLDVSGPVVEDQVSFDPGLRRSLSTLTSPSANATAGELAVGLFGAYNYQQSFAPDAGWSLAGTAANCTRALAESQIVDTSGSPSASVVVGSATRFMSGLLTFTTGAVTPPPPPPPPPPAPENSSAPTVTGTPQQGQTLTTSDGAWTNDPTSYSYAWEDCDALGDVCSRIGGASSRTYVLQSSDVGSTVRSIVTATNAGGSNSARSDATAVVTAPPPPVNTRLPVISGQTIQGQSLSTTNGTWTGDPTSYRYQWQACDTSGDNCTPITGATSASYALQPADVGRTLRAVVTASNSAGSASQASAQSGVISGSSGKVGWSAAYYPGWESGSAPVATLPWNAITELIVFSYGPNADGSLNTTDHGLSPALQTAAVAAAHAHGRLALISIGGAEFGTVWEGACGSAARASFVNNIVTQMRLYGYDGVDLDIEHDWGGPSHPDYVACVQAMRNALDAVTTAQGKRPMLTEPCDPSWQAYMCTQVSQYLDQINMMGYGSDCTLTNCSEVAQDISNMTTRGIPKSLIGIGIGLDPGMPAATAPHSAAVCSSTAQYAVANGVGGVMEWSVQDDPMNNGGQTPCFDSLAPYVGS